MFDLKLIRETPDIFRDGWKRRGFQESPVDKIIELDEKRRKALTESQELQSKRNEASKQIGALKSKGGDATALMQEVASYKERGAALEEEEKKISSELNDFLSRLPNIPDASVPLGASEKDNVEVRKVGEPKRLNNPMDHVAIGEGLGGMDFETAAKMSGARFVVLRSGVARLERALAQFMLDTHTQEHGFTEMNVPLLVNGNALYGTGQLPKFENELFKTVSAAFLDKDEIRKKVSEEIRKSLLQEIEEKIKSGTAKSFSEELKEGLEKIEKLDLEGYIKDAAYKEAAKYLIPTSEVSLTNTVMDSIVDIGDLPLRLTSLTPCFRSEAGAAGKDTKGIIRQHQFYKVEMVSITAADKSDEEHKRMTECAENILKKLDLAFRTITLCTGDMGFSARKTYDIEVWLPGQNAYREISSCSNCGDFQARRMKTRYKAAGDKNTTFVHTLNGSGLAVGRTLVAVLENYQQMDGSVIIPDVLKPYMGGITKLEPVAKKGKAVNA